MLLNELIQLSKQNDSKAQSLLMNKFWYDVKSYVLSLVKEDADAEDVTIETFTKVFSKLELYNSDFDFKNWVISIAHNTALDLLRKRKNFNLSFENYQYNSLEKSPSVEELLIQKQAEDTFLDKIKSLDEKYKKVLELRYLEDMSVIEISEKLEISISNTKVRLMRAKKLIENQFNKNES